MTNYSFVNVCKFTAASAGTGSFVVSAAVSGYQTPLTAGASNFNYRYRAESADLTQWEVGSGAYTSSNTTLTRTPIINSAGGSSAINFTVAPQVGLVLLSNDFQGTGQILGNDGTTSASAGNVGELLSIKTESSSPVTSGGSGVNTTVATLSLTAGDWDLQGAGGALPSSAISLFLSAISSDPAILGGTILNYTSVLQGTIAGTQSMSLPYRRYLTSVSTTLYLVSRCTHGSSLSYFGQIDARRAR